MCDTIIHANFHQSSNLSMPFTPTQHDPHCIHAGPDTEESSALQGIEDG
jgi:hypothetical protein